MTPPYKTFFYDYHVHPGLLYKKTPWVDVPIQGYGPYYQALSWCKQAGSQICRKYYTKRCRVTYSMCVSVPTVASLVYTEYTIETTEIGEASLKN